MDQLSKKIQEKTDKKENQEKDENLNESEIKQDEKEKDSKLEKTPVPSKVSYKIKNIF